MARYIDVTTRSMVGIVRIRTIPIKGWAKTTLSGTDAVCQQRMSPLRHRKQVADLVAEGEAIC